MKLSRNRAGNIQTLLWLWGSCWHHSLELHKYQTSKCREDRKRGWRGVSNNYWLVGFYWFVFSWCLWEVKLRLNIISNSNTVHLQYMYPSDMTNFILQYAPAVFLSFRTAWFRPWLKAACHWLVNASMCMCAFVCMFHHPVKHGLLKSIHCRVFVSSTLHAEHCSKLQ